jgi:hypothetical protein
VRILRHWEKYVHFLSKLPDREVLETWACLRLYIANCCNLCDKKKLVRPLAIFSCSCIFALILANQPEAWLESFSPLLH